MKRTKTETAGDAIRLFLRAHGLETPLKEHTIIAEWADVAGHDVGQVSKALYIKEQKLYVAVHNAPLRANLIMRRKELISKLNARVNEIIIYDIVFV